MQCFILTHFDKAASLGFWILVFPAVMRSCDLKEVVLAVPWYGSVVVRRRVLIGPPPSDVLPTGSLASGWNTHTLARIRAVLAPSMDMRHLLAALCHSGLYQIFFIFCS